MLFQEGLDTALMGIVDKVGVPFEGGPVEELFTVACAHVHFLKFLIVVGHSWQLAPLPVEVALVPGVVHRAKEKETKEDQTEFVDVPQLRRILRLHHDLCVCCLIFLFSINY